MFINKKRIEEDLEIAKRSILNLEPLENQARIDDSQEGLKFADFVDLCSAAYSVILPWAIAFAVLLGLAGWLLVRWVS